MWRQCAEAVNEAHQIHDDAVTTAIINRMKRAEEVMLNSLNELSADKNGLNPKQVEQHRDIIKKEVDGLIKALKDSRQLKRAKISVYTQDLLQIAKDKGLE